MISAFFAGIGGGLYGALLGTVDPKNFLFTLTYNFLLIIVLGGMGSITGSMLGAVIVTAGLEYLRVFDEPLELFGWLFLCSVPVSVWSCSQSSDVLRPFLAQRHHGYGGIYLGQVREFLQASPGLFLPRRGRMLNERFKTDNITMQFGGVIAVNELAIDVKSMRSSL
jgi:hypothetical protein